MSNELIFDILSFDPLIVPNREVQLPIDVADLASQLQEKLPDADLEFHKSESQSTIRVYIQTEKYGPRILVTFHQDDDFSQFNVYGWPKYISRELIYWYRQYIPISYPLFLVIPSRGYVAELTADTSLEDIDKMYPYSVPDD